MPPPYLVDIDGHPHPLRGQNGILELIRPSLNLNYSKKEEVVDALVDYDEFMKRRQMQLACENKQLTEVFVNRLLKTREDNNHVYENNRDTLCDDQPCCSSSSSSQLFIQSQDSNVTMETKEAGNDNTLLHNLKNEEGNCEKDFVTSKISTSNVMQTTNAIVNGHSVVTGKQETTAVDYQNRNSDHSLIDLDQNGQSSNQAVIKGDQASVKNGRDLVNSQQQVNDQAADNNQGVINDQQAGMINNGDEINILEFDNSDDSGGGTNNNILTSIVWSCGLSDQEAKNAVTMWLSRIVIPHMDSELYW